MKDVNGDHKGHAHRQLKIHVLTDAEKCQRTFYANSSPQTFTET